jgi:leucyl aminopeptidase
MLNVRFSKSIEGLDLVAAPVSPHEWSAGALAIDHEVGGALRRAALAVDFDAKNGSVLDVPGLPDQPSRIVLLGVEDATLQSSERLGARLVKHAASVRAKRIGIHAGVLDAAAVAGGAVLAAYRFDRYRRHTLDAKPDKQPTLTEICILCGDPETASRDWAQKSARYLAALEVRDLINEPPNTLTPTRFAQLAKELATLGVEVTVLDEAAMAALGMNALVGVGAGSAQDSKLVALTWRGAAPSAPYTALVGKGVTFDTGGVSIKPAANMDEMKCDMAGAAVVMATLRASAARKARLNIVGVLALAENMPDGTAIKPADILTTMSGQTVEIINTDAEGRLVLADALTWVQREYRPTRIIDLATLTGAMIISLGHVHAGLFCNDDDLAATITRAGAESGETVWRMPLDAAYAQLMDSTVADMKNAHVKDSGAITAATFLQRFIAPGVAWAHLDIAGVATHAVGDDPRKPVWATGWGPGLLDAALRQLEAL